MGSNLFADAPVEDEDFALVPVRVRATHAALEESSLPSIDSLNPRFLTEELEPDVTTVREFLNRKFLCGEREISGREIIKTILAIEESEPVYKEHGVGAQLLADHLELRGAELRGLISALESAQHESLIRSEFNQRQEMTYKPHQIFSDKNILEPNQTLGEEATEFLKLKFGGAFKEGATIADMMQLFGEHSALSQILVSEELSDLIGDSRLPDITSLLEERLIPKAIELGILESWPMPKSWSRWSGAPGYILSEAATKLIFGEQSEHKASAAS